MKTNFSEQRIEQFCRLLEESNQFDVLEIKILRAMLQLKDKSLQNTANIIAKEAKISVTNAYKYLYSLQEKGLVECTKPSKNNSKNLAKKKIFWLTQSSNPFPRILSDIGKQYLETKKLFSDLEDLYNKVNPGYKVWQNEKVFEHYNGIDNWINRMALLFDIAKKEILITTDKFFIDFALLDALKRAVERGVVIKILAEEIDPVRAEKLRKIDIQMRLGCGWPYIVLVDEFHGMSIDKDKKGIWFLNYKTEYKNKFLGFWEKGDEI